MTTKTKRAKCPGCLPDRAGAIFESVEGGAWTCRNCGHQLPPRKVSAATLMAHAQLRAKLREEELTEKVAELKKALEAVGTAAIRALGESAHDKHQALQRIASRTLETLQVASHPDCVRYGCSEAADGHRRCDVKCRLACNEAMRTARRAALAGDA